MFEEIKDAVSTKEAASFYGLRIGRNSMCCCPFHDDKTPSMKVDKRFHCFGCGADGDVINFVQKLYGMDAKTAAHKMISDFRLNIETDHKETAKERNARIKRAKEAEYEKSVRAAYALELRDFRFKMAEYHRTLHRWSVVVQDQVWGRVTENRGNGKSTRYYADEMHLLLKEEQTAAFTVEIWKRFRKWGGIPTGITQNVKDLLASPEVGNIFENSDFVYLLNQGPDGQEILTKNLHISPQQLQYVTHSGPGEGLIIYDNVILPFVDKFPTDIELYKIMTTKLSEVVGE